MPDIIGQSELENPQGENLRLESGVSAAPFPTNNTVRDYNQNSTFNVMFDIFFTSILQAFYPILTSGSFYPVPVRPDRCEEDTLVCSCLLLRPAESL